MNDTRSGRLGGTTTVMLLAFLLFYLPSVLAIFSRSHEPAGWIAMSVCMATLYTAVFCLNYFWLVPAMLIRSDRKTLYFLINLAVILSLCVLVPLIFRIVGEVPWPKRLRAHEPAGMAHILIGYLRFVLRDGVMMVLSAALAYAMRLSRERENVHRQELELDVERRQIELKSLKAQLNPHFLFNSLNNIYALIGFAPDRAQQSLHDLSNMLRFMIYDSTSPTVPLSKEIQFISDYSELMKLRLNSSVRLTFKTDIPEDNGLHIAPLLFLTIVENAFKHSGPNDSDNFISINITLADGMLTGKVSNSMSPKEEEGKSLPSEESGVGLVNIRRQLGLLYPDAHSFTIEKKDGVFTAMIAVRASVLSQQPVVKGNPDGKTFSKHNTYQHIWQKPSNA